MAHVAARLKMDPRYHYLSVPYPVVVGGYVLAWARLLVWRARKYRKVSLD